MDIYQLGEVLTRGLGPLFWGVYPKDLLPETLNQKAIVINTTPMINLEFIGSMSI
jgi:hypothetical protein